LQKAAPVLIEQWRVEYNTQRSHSALNPGKLDEPYVLHDQDSAKD
jgi:hypothetical protein